MIEARLNGADKKYIEKAKILTQKEVELLILIAGKKLRRHDDTDSSNILRTLAIMLKMEEKNFRNGVWLEFL